MTPKASFVTAFALTGALAIAGENRFLGTLRSTGSSVTNASNLVTGTLPDGGSGLVPDAFVIPANAKVTIDCDADARILTDSLSVSRSGEKKGVRVASETLFPSSVGQHLATVDAGAGLQRAATALVAVISSAADGGTNCDVWQRSGTE